MVEWEAAERTEGGQGEKETMLGREDRVGRGDQAQAAAARWWRVGGSSHNSAVFNCSAHAPPWILHYYTIGLLVLPPLSVKQRCSHIAEASKWSLPPLWGGRPHLGRPTHEPDPLSHHIIARLIYRGDRWVTGKYNKFSHKNKNICWHFKAFFISICFNEAV